MANSGSVTHCGGGSSQERIECIVRACQYNMTNDCFNAMLETPQDFANFQPLLVRTCALGQAGGLNVPLSDNCRRVCRMDPTSCRARRQQYCAKFADPNDPRSRELCACYLPSYIYTRITAEAIADLAVKTGEQLATLQDVISNNLLTPSCWYGNCTSSQYGLDTEAAIPCQSLGLCIQSISGEGTRFEGRVDLENSCTIDMTRRGGSEMGDAVIPIEGTCESCTRSDVVGTVPPTSYTTSWWWIWPLIIAFLVIGLIVILYVMIRRSNRSVSATVNG